MTFFRVYELAAPLLLLPLAYGLWLQRSGGDHLLAAAAVELPVVFAYVIPGLGTNVLGLWEVRSRWRLGKFRLHHGFVFGSATSLLAAIAVPPVSKALGSWQIAQTAFVLGSVLAFWNWLYDIYGIKAGVLLVYNRPYAEHAGAEAIATDYAPVFFGTFGAAYGAALESLRYALLELARRDLFGWLLATAHVVVLVSPVAAFVALSYRRHGTNGLRPCGREGSPGMAA